jgi:hypothetical protein
MDTVSDIISAISSVLISLFSSILIFSSFASQDSGFSLSNFTFFPLRSLLSPSSEIPKGSFIPLCFMVKLIFFFHDILNICVNLSVKKSFCIIISFIASSHDIESHTFSLCSF